MVKATPKGKQVAARADEILGTPPPALSALSAKDLEALIRVLKKIPPDDHR